MYPDLSRYAPWTPFAALAVALALAGTGPVAAVEGAPDGVRPEVTQAPTETAARGKRYQGPRGGSR